MRKNQISPLNQTNFSKIPIHINNKPPFFFFYLIYHLAHTAFKFPAMQASKNYMQKDNFLYPMK